MNKELTAMLADGRFEAALTRGFEDAFAKAIPAAIAEKIPQRPANRVVFTPPTPGGPEALTTAVERQPAVSSDPRADGLIGFLICEAWAKSAGSKDEVRFAQLDRQLGDITARATVLRAAAAIVARDSSPEALRAAAQENVLQNKVAKVRRDNADLEASIEDAEVRIAKMEGKPAPAGSSVRDAIAKAHKSPKAVAAHGYYDED